MSATLDAPPPAAASVLSPGDLAVAGFGVAGRDWRLVVGWSLFNLLALVVGCVVLSIALLFVVALVGSDRLEGIGPALGMVVLTLGGLAVQVMIVAALYRRMLRGTAPEFLYLRIGPDEARLFAVALILGVAVGAPFALAGVVAGAAPAIGGWALLAALALAVWVLVRLSLVGAATFAERRIDFAQAWRLTRGHQARLFGTLVLSVFLTAMIEVVLWLAITLGTGAIGGFQDLLQPDADAFATHPLRYLLSVVLNLAASPFLLTLFYAPWAAAYRQLKA